MCKSVLSSLLSLAILYKSSWSSPVEDAFLVKLPGCTGTLIAQDWVLSAGHCYYGLRFMSQATVEGDLSIDLSQDFGENGFVEKVKTLEDPNVTPWRAPYEQQFLFNDTLAEEVQALSENVWRKVKRVIIHGDFQGEALSWKGFDFALIQLEPGSFFHRSNEEGIIPACLPKEEVEGEDVLKMAGFGRRYVPHCMTSGDGPEKYAVCGRPIQCAKDHKTQFCGLNFLFNGTHHRDCIRDDTPSAHDPICQRVWGQYIGSHLRVGHIFKETMAQKYAHVVSCYPRRPPTGSKGWCTTRDPGESKNIEPGTDHGWGFCSVDDRQAYCREIIPTKTDSAAMNVSVFHDEACLKEIKWNLQVEQPFVKKEEYQNLSERAKLFCAGQNHSTSLAEDGIFLFDRSKDSMKKVTRPSNKKTLQNILFSSGRIERNSLEGGPGCFGDSGGPAFKLIQGDAHDRVPVVVGVFSFMLWGTCGSREEPSFYGRVNSINAWILKYIEHNQLCYA